MQPEWFSDGFVKGLALGQFGAIGNGFPNKIDNQKDGGADSPFGSKVECPEKGHAAQISEEERGISNGQQRSSDVADQKDEENYCVPDMAAFAVDLQQRPDEEHGHAGSSNQTGSRGANAQDEGVGQGVGRDVPPQADASADGVEAEKEHDKGDIVEENRMPQKVAQRGNSGFSMKSAGPKGIVETNHRREEKGNKQFVTVALPPMSGAMDEGKQGDTEKQQNKRKRPVERGRGGFMVRWHMCVCLLRNIWRAKTGLWYCRGAAWHLLQAAQLSQKSIFASGCQAEPCCFCFLAFPVVSLAYAEPSQALSYGAEAVHKIKRIPAGNKEQSMAAPQHLAMNCLDRIRQERFYTRHFGFRRVRVFNPGTANEFVMLRLDGMCIELFAVPPGTTGEGGQQPVGFKHLAFEVESLEQKIRDLNADGIRTDGIIDCSGILPGMRVCFFRDPEGNILEMMEGWKDEMDPPALAAE